MADQSLRTKSRQASRQCDDTDMAAVRGPLAFPPALLVDTSPSLDKQVDPDHAQPHMDGLSPWPVRSPQVQLQVRSLLAGQEPERSPSPHSPLGYDQYGLPTAPPPPVHSHARSRSRSRSVSPNVSTGGASPLPHQQRPGRTGSPLSGVRSASQGGANSPPSHPGSPGRAVGEARPPQWQPPQPVYHQQQHSSRGSYGRPSPTSVPDGRPSSGSTPQQQQRRPSRTSVQQVVPSPSHLQPRQRQPMPVNDHRPVPSKFSKNTDAIRFQAPPRSPSPNRAQLAAAIALASQPSAGSTLARTVRNGSGATIPTLACVMDGVARRAENHKVRTRHWERRGRSPRRLTRGHQAHVDPQEGPINHQTLADWEILLEQNRSRLMHQIEEVTELLKVPAGPMSPSGSVHSAYSHGGSARGSARPDSRSTGPGSAGTYGTGKVIEFEDDILTTMHSDLEAARQNPVVVVPPDPAAVAAATALLARGSLTQLSDMAQAQVHALTASRAQALAAEASSASSSVLLSERSSVAAGAAGDSPRAGGAAGFAGAELSLLHMGVGQEGSQGAGVDGATATGVSLPQVVRTDSGHVVTSGSRPGSAASAGSRHSGGARPGSATSGRGSVRAGSVAPGAEGSLGAAPSAGSVHSVYMEGSMTELQQDQEGLQEDGSTRLPPIGTGSRPGSAHSGAPSVQASYTSEGGAVSLPPIPGAVDAARAGAGSGHGSPPGSRPRSASQGGSRHGSRPTSATSRKSAATTAAGEEGDMGALHATEGHVELSGTGEGAGEGAMSPLAQHVGAHRPAGAVLGRQPSRLSISASPIPDAGEGTESPAVGGALPTVGEEGSEEGSGGSGQGQRSAAAAAAAAGTDGGLHTATSFGPRSFTPGGSLVPLPPADLNPVQTSGIGYTVVKSVIVALPDAEEVALGKKEEELGLVEQALADQSSRVSRLKDASRAAKALSKVAPQTQEDEPSSLPSAMRIASYPRSRRGIVSPPKEPGRSPVRERPFPSPPRTASTPSTAHPGPQLPKPPRPSEGQFKDEEFISKAGPAQVQDIWLH